MPASPPKRSLIMMYSNNFESSFHWGSKFGSNTENASEPLQSLTKHSGELFSTSKVFFTKKKKEKKKCKLAMQVGVAVRP